MTASRALFDSPATTSTTSMMSPVTSTSSPAMIHPTVLGTDDDTLILEHDTPVVSLSQTACRGKRCESHSINVCSVNIFMCKFVFV